MRRKWIGYIAFVVIIGASIPARAADTNDTTGAAGDPPAAATNAAPPEKMAPNSSTAPGVIAPKATPAPGAMKPTETQSAPNNAPSPAK